MSEHEDQAPTDGFRERQTRPKGWAKRAMKEGVIADPDNPKPEPVYDTSRSMVFEVPAATISGKGEETH